MLILDKEGRNYYGSTLWNTVARTGRIPIVNDVMELAALHIELDPLALHLHPRSNAVLYANSPLATLPTYALWLWAIV